MLSNTYSIDQLELLDSATVMENTLQKIFGFPAFRPYQEDIVQAITDGRDVFAVMPTGGGKSLCYQLPAYLIPGVCLVVSPLISLMKDQVDAAKRRGLRADYLNSSQTTEERDIVQKRLREGHLDLLYVSPERLATAEFRQQMEGLLLSFIAIDEAHCISDWGHDFRPDYLGLADLVHQFPNTPIAAFTATATLTVQADIISRLSLRDPFCVRASFNRENLYYAAEPKEDVNRQILDFIRLHPKQHGIVYRCTRSDVEETAQWLVRHGIKALPYHAGLNDRVRINNQNAFDRGRVHVVVATIAFGMGIDKPDVRYVVHGDLPRTLEAYYQETGRAGRDGARADCLLLHSPSDADRLRYFINQSDNPTKRAHALESLQQMAAFASGHSCRRKRLLAYFGEHLPVEKCGLCDWCAP